ncbi:hypothetical protein [uncultured Thioclava sp.]|uniref:hypothetical protein n=1 Tax=uncultured Thioclava sp. TaxID=473858 RepID=UPI0025E67D4E|nr:hypothetical protein [uncultured Thioclava sp.]
MSQVANLTVPDGSGVEVRQGFNASINAVATDYSGATAPTNTFAGMKWRDTSISPSVLKIRNDANTAWVEALSALGASTAGKTLLTAADKAAQRTALELKAGAQKDLSGDPDFTGVAPNDLADRETIAAAIAASSSTPFESAEYSITAAGALTIAHGLGVQPTLYLPYLKCKTADNGYSVGDELLINPSLNVAGAYDSGVALVPDATNIDVRFGANGNVLQIIHKTSGGRAPIASGTTAWKFFVRAWK